MRAHWTFLTVTGFIASSGFASVTLKAPGMVNDRGEGKSGRGLRDLQDAIALSKPVVIPPGFDTLLISRFFAR